MKTLYTTIDKVRLVLASLGTIVISLLLLGAGCGGDNTTDTNTQNATNEVANEIEEEVDEADEEISDTFETDVDVDIPGIPENASEMSVHATIEEVDALSMFEQLVEETGYADELDDPDQTFTVFAPTDDAFMDADMYDRINQLLQDENEEELKTIVEKYIVEDEIYAEEITDEMEVTTVNGDSITLTDDNGMLSFDNAPVLGNDIVTQNGVIHILDGVVE